jgi:hypothetical protein
MKYNSLNAEFCKIKEETLFYFCIPISILYLATSINNKIIKLEGQMMNFAET